MRARAALFALFAAMPAAAQENGDLARIPSAIGNEETPAPQANAHGKYYLEDAFALSSSRGTFAVAFPSPKSSPWANRSSLDALDQWNLSSSLTASFSDRLNVTFADGIGFPGEAVHNDLREAYLTWEPLTQTYLEFGRINLKNGIALGFNPTDFFKSRTLVSQSSSDPSALRGDRLGTVMLRAQRIWDGGSLTIVYAPKLHTPSPLTSTPDWIDPKLDQTNGADRLLVSLNLDLGELNPQALIYHESGRTKFGLNLSQPIGQSVIAYAEWAGGVGPNLIAQAVAFGKATGTLPAFVPVLPPTDTSSAFRNDLAVGASWTSTEKISVNLEYHYHQAGFSRQDWRNWFAVGADPALAPELWYVRAYASDQQQPATQHEVFFRADWSQPFTIEDLDISGFALTDLGDGSGLGQLTANYDLSDNWSVAAYLGGSLGGRRSDWGSTPGAASAIVQVVRYF